ncbi:MULTISPECIES: hypothetical protein [unclassified Caballeronia]|uniref:hypothetical protein n=1 Tax=unclassified Caballeronia TaxID=2646786 RepID=UPI002858DAB9|nr:MULTISPECIES: hypothetical protein [unclassified Caballeronia]MDR5737142.1 hypothetical protein [Caballeronia sp. LZ016]MDR5810329.1 hypothetical protein [Caballeronia sp. LZ019]
MSTWMWIVGVWIVFAACVVLFVRGASARTDAVEESRDEVAPAPADRSRVKQV